MKILHLLSQKPEATGSGMMVRALIREASKAGHQNYLLAGVDCLESPPEIPDMSPECCSYVEFGGGDLPYDIVGMSDVMPYRSCRFSSLSEKELSLYQDCFREELEKAVADFHPDIIHSNHLWILTSTARKAVSQIPVIATCHGTDIRQYHLCPDLRDIVSKGCSTVDAVLVLTELQREEVRALYEIPENRIHVIGTGYDDQLFKPGVKSTEGPLEVVYAGKLSRAKGVIYLLEALHAVNTDFILHVAGAGTGPEEEEIRRTASVSGNSVVFHGPLSHRLLASLMGRSHIFTLPSLYEGFPLVVLEALASRCLIVATALPSLREIFSNDAWSRYVKLVPPPSMQGPDTPCESDIPDFISALRDAVLEQFKAAENLRSIKHCASDSILSDLLIQYRWSNVFSRIEGVYTSLAASHRQVQAHTCLPWGAQKRMPVMKDRNKKPQE